MNVTADENGNVAWENDHDPAFNLRYRPYDPNIGYNMFWDFDSDESLEGWKVYDADADGMTWRLTDYGVDGSYCITSDSYYSGARTPDNWAFSPEVKLGGTLTFKTSNYSSTYPDKFTVCVCVGEFETEDGVDVSKFVEISDFIQPGTELDWFQKWKQFRMKWHQNLGFGAENYRFHDHDKLAHYANAATDIEFRMPFGFKEVEGIHSRTNFDLSQHAKYSGKKIEYFDPETNESYTPYVIETSIGVDRMFLSIMCHSYEEQQLPDGQTRTVLHLPAALAPVKLAVFPLTKKDGMPEKAQEIINDLRFHFNCKYEEKDQIGKRYRRMDAIGCPYCVTVDQQTLEDNTVTLRDRDTMEQKRVAISELRSIIEDKVSITSLLKKLL